MREVRGSNPAGYVLYLFSAEKARNARARGLGLRIPRDLHFDVNKFVTEFDLPLFVLSVDIRIMQVWAYFDNFMHVTFAMDIKFTFEHFSLNFNIAISDFKVLYK